MTGRITKKYDACLNANGMNGGYGLFLTETRSCLDGTFLGTSKDQALMSILEINQNRRLLSLPEIKVLT